MNTEGRSPKALPAELRGGSELAQVQLSTGSFRSPTLAGKLHVFSTEPGRDEAVLAITGFCPLT